MNRVNKVTARYVGNMVFVSLYKNNNRLLELNQDDLQLPKYDSTKFKSKNVYLTYCKEIVINLVKNGGIDGYTYSEVQEYNGVSKYDLKSAVDTAIDKVQTVLEKIKDGGYITEYVRVTDSHKDTETDIATYYKDGKIKYGEIYLTFNIDGLNIRVLVAIMSGQMTKPKGYTTENNDTLRILNKTNLRRDLSINE